MIQNQSEPKIYILREMQSSLAFRSLSRVSLLVLTDFFAKRKMARAGREYQGGKRTSKTNWIITNNGEIQYPYSEAVKNGFSRVQFRNAVDELQRKGFIDIAHVGKGGRKPVDGTGDVTLYRLDERWRTYNPETGIADQSPSKPRQPDKRLDRGFQKFWRDREQIVGIENDTS